MVKDLIILNFRNMLIDKALVNVDGYQLDETWDLKTVSDTMSIVQGAQVRIISKKGSWIYDEEFGSMLYKEILDSSPIFITEKKIKDIVNLAIKPLIEDGRLEAVLNTSIVEKTETSITISIDFKINNGTVTSIYNIIF